MAGDKKSATLLRTFTESYVEVRGKGSGWTALERPNPIERQVNEWVADTGDTFNIPED